MPPPLDLSPETVLAVRTAVRDTNEPVRAIAKRLGISRAVVDREIVSLRGDGGRRLVRAGRGRGRTSALPAGDRLSMSSLPPLRCLGQAGE